MFACMNKENVFQIAKLSKPSDILLLAYYYFQILYFQFLLFVVLFVCLFAWVFVLFLFLFFVLRVYEWIFIRSFRLSDLCLSPNTNDHSGSWDPTMVFLIFYYYHVTFICWLVLYVIITLMDMFLFARDIIKSSKALKR